MTFREFVRHSLKVGLVISPATGLNYGLVLYFGTYEIRSVLGFSLVVIGDVLGAALNFYMLYRYKRWLAK